MSNFQIMQDFQQFLFDAECIGLPFTTISFEKTNNSIYENYALINELLDGKQITQIEEIFRKIDRIPSIYFENREELRQNIRFLNEQSYTHNWHDSWLFYENKIQNDERLDGIITVKTPEELEIFLRTFNNCYQKNDPQNPYGEVTPYLEGSKNRWLQHNTNEALKYFIAFDNNDPVAVAALTSYKGLGYISAVGSLPKARGKGFGKKISLFAVYTSQQMGNAKHFLLTEVGTHPYKFYKGIGFVEKFTAVGMYK